MVLKTNIIQSFLLFSLLFTFTKANELISVDAEAILNFAGNANGDFFGASVSSAGDINNDGYDDIIIGAPYRGAVYVIYGGENSTLTSIDLSLTTLDPMTTGFMITGAASGDNLGYSVSGAGDIDNDGYDDIIIGAYHKDSNKGAVYVIYGGEKSSMLNIDLSISSLNPGATGFIIKGNTTGNLLGSSVSSAGDINNDGYTDIIFGAPMKNSWEGAVYVIYGGPKSSMSDIDLSTTTLDPLTTGFMMKAAATNDHFGSSVSTAGDLNKDGYADILIGAYCGNNFKGAVYAIYGGEKSSMQNIDFSNFTLDPTTTGFAIKGNTDYDYLGGSVSSAGDLNQDGYTDILIGAVGSDHSKGAAYVVYGGEKSKMSNIDLSTTTLNPLTTGFTIKGAISGYQFGYSLSCAGDINKDGVNDIIIGAVWGKAHIVYGRKTGLSDIDLSSSTSYPTTTGFMILGPSNAQRYGQSLASVDINNDGFTDVLVGAPGTNSNRGSAYLIISSECSQGCRICPSTSKCTECFDGYALNNSQCGACPSNCHSCSVPSVCDVCSPGKYLFQGQCFDLCPSSTFSMSNGTCQSCPVVCTKCSSDSVCDVCSSGKYLYQAQCLDMCPTSLYPASDGICRSCPMGCIKCSSDSVCDICSSGKYLSQAQCADTCPLSTFPTSNGICQNCSVGCKNCSSDSICDVCSSGKYLFQAQCVDTCPASTFPTGNGICQSCPAGCTQCTSESNCQACADGFDLSDSKSCQKIPEEKKGEKASAGAFEGTSLVGASLNSGSSLPLNFGMVAKILRNVKYLDITVSPELMQTFYSWKVDSGFMAAPKSWSLKYESNVLPVLKGLIGLAIFMIFKSIEMVLTKKNRQKNILFSISRHVHIAASNFALTQFYSNLDDAILYFIIEARSTKFDSGFRVFSSLLAVILVLIGGIFIGLHSKLLKTYQALKHTGSSAELEVFVTKCDNINTIMKDFKDITLLTQSFLLINLIRSIISSLVFAILFDYPLLQIAILFVLNTLMIVYLLKKKPFKDPFHTYGQVFCEVVLLVANFCVFILAVFAYVESSPIDSIERLSQCIMALNYILLLGCAVLLVINIGKIFYKTYKERKSTRSTTAPIVVTESTAKILNDRSVIMDQSEVVEQSSFTDIIKALEPTLQLEMTGQSNFASASDKVELETSNHPIIENEVFAYRHSIQINYTIEEVFSSNVFNSFKFIQNRDKRRMIGASQRSSEVTGLENQVQDQSGVQSQEKTNNMDIEIVNLDVEAESSSSQLSVTKRKIRENKDILAEIVE